MKVAGLGPVVKDFVRIRAMTMVPIKNPWAITMGKNLVDRSAASAFAFKIQWWRQHLLSVMSVVVRRGRPLIKVS